MHYLELQKKYTKYKMNSNPGWHWLYGTGCMALCTTVLLPHKLHNDSSEMSLPVPDDLKKGVQHDCLLTNKTGSAQRYLYMVHFLYK